MKYLKVFTDFAEAIEPINDAEAGRLFRAMLKYAETGETPIFSGNEKYIWPTAKLNIDREAAYCEYRKKNGMKRKSKHEQDEANESKQEQDEANESGLFKKDKDKDKDKDYITPLPSFVHSKTGRDDEDGLERTIDGLHLDLYEGMAGQFAKAVENAIRTMWRREHIRVNGDVIPQGAVRSVLRSLTIDHIDYLLEKLEAAGTEEPVTNGQAYLMACIYNAPADFAVNNQRSYGR